MISKDSLKHVKPTNRLENSFVNADPQWNILNWSLYREGHPLDLKTTSKNTLVSSGSVSNPFDF